ncbi:MAG: hypothetical protein E6H55_04885 [Betaproteobacteria bacterium]|nr:MAG: hypothetical protein E6H55_04885 [Betaproteobacteria bacterium]
MSLRTMGADAVLLVAFIAAAGAGSLLLGQDVNWDLQNYHYYNPWAWWHGRIFNQDLAAAQIQTFLNPLLDLPFYWMVTAEWSPRVIAFVLAIPAAIAAFFLCKLLLLMFGDLPRGQRVVAIASSLAIGVTSAMAIGELGSTLNEWPLAALLMLALWLIARELKRAETGPWSQASSLAWHQAPNLRPPRLPSVCAERCSSVARTRGQPFAHASPTRYGSGWP